MIRLTDGVITLRPFTLADVKEHLAEEDEEQVKWLSGGKGTQEGVEHWIKKNQQNWIADGPIFNFAIEDNSGKLVGMVEANTDYQRIDGVEAGGANISYGIYPFARGKGYASRAVLLLADFLKDKGIKRGVIRVDPQNTESLKVSERCGFTKEKAITTKEGDALAIFVKDLL